MEKSTNLKICIEMLINVLKVEEESLFAGVVQLVGCRLFWRLSGGRRLRKSIKIGVKELWLLWLVVTLLLLNLLKIFKTIQNLHNNSQQNQVLKIMIFLLAVLKVVKLRGLLEQFGSQLKFHIENHTSYMETLTKY